MKRPGEGLGGAGRQEWGLHELLNVSHILICLVRVQVELAGRNVAKLHINTADTLEVFRILNADRIIIERSALNYIHDFYGSKPLEVKEDAAAEAAAPSAAEVSAEVSAEAPGAVTEAAAAEAPEEAVAEGAESPLEAQSS